MLGTGRRIKYAELMLSLLEILLYRQEESLLQLQQQLWFPEKPEKVVGVFLLLLPWMSTGM